MSRSNEIIYDIETTGLSVTSATTTTITTYNLDSGDFTVFINPDNSADATAKGIEQHVEEKLSNWTYANVTVDVCSPRQSRFEVQQPVNGEHALLTAFGSYLDSFDSEVHLIGWNSGGSYNKSGFDASWLRSAAMQYGDMYPVAGTQTLDARDLLLGRDGPRLTRNDISVENIRNKSGVTTFGEDYLGVDMPSNGARRAELEDAVEGRCRDEALRAYFVSEEGDIPKKSPSTLDDVHEVLVDLTAGDGRVTIDPVDYDPLDGESEEAIAAWERGDVEQVVLHNLADVHMTGDAYQLGVQQAPDRALSWTRL